MSRPLHSVLEAWQWLCATIQFVAQYLLSATTSVPPAKMYLLQPGGILRRKKHSWFTICCNMILSSRCADTYLHGDMLTTRYGMVLSYVHNEGAHKDYFALSFVCKHTLLVAKQVLQVCSRERLVYRLCQPNSMAVVTTDDFWLPTDSSNNLLAVLEKNLHV